MCSGDVWRVRLAGLETATHTYDFKGAAAFQCRYAQDFTPPSALTIQALRACWKRSKHEARVQLLTCIPLCVCAAYVGSVLATLYSALILKSYLFSLLSSGLQVILHD